jgi:excisionase family DNA binding protein
VTDDEWPEFLTVKEVAQIMRVCTMTVYRLVKDGTLDTLRVGRSFRIYADSVRLLLKTGTWR